MLQLKVNFRIVWHKKENKFMVDRLDDTTFIVCILEYFIQALGW